jgi:hydrogenase nickel incorporation protein HypB
LQQLDTRELDILIIENVGNLVCPAEFDLGETLRVVLLSTTEGEDKPLKYPPLFHSAHVALITKSDLAEAAGFDRAAARKNLERISHHADLFELSARTGAGMDAWCDYLTRCHANVNKIPHSAAHHA